MIVASISEFHQGLQIYYVSSKDPLTVMTIDSVSHDVLREKSMEIFDQFNERDDDYDVRIDNEEDFFKGFHVVVMSEKERKFFKTILPKAEVTKFRDLPTYVLMNNWVRVIFGIDNSIIVGQCEEVDCYGNFVPLKIRFLSPREINTLDLVTYNNGVVDMETRDRLAREWKEQTNSYKQIVQRCENTYKGLKGETLVVLSDEQKNLFEKILPNATITVEATVPRYVQAACWLYNQSNTDMLAKVYFPENRDPVITIARQTNPRKHEYIQMPKMHCFRRMRQYFTEFGARTVYIADNEDFFKDICKVPTTKVTLNENYKYYSNSDEYNFFKSSVPPPYL